MPSWVSPASPASMAMRGQAQRLPFSQTACKTSDGQRGSAGHCTTLNCSSRLRWTLLHSTPLSGSEGRARHPLWTCQSEERLLISSETHVFSPLRSLCVSQLSPLLCSVVCGGNLRVSTAQCVGGGRLRERRGNDFSLCFSPSCDLHPPPWLATQVARPTSC